MRSEDLMKNFHEVVLDIERRERSMSSMKDTMEKRLMDLEKREKNFDLMNLTGESDLKSREEKLDEQLKLVHDHIERLEVAYNGVAEIRRQECEKLKEIEKKERQVDSVRGLLEKRLNEVDEREIEFDSFQDRKMRELVSREEALNRKSEDFIKLANEKLREGEKLGSGLIGKFESALSVLEGMKVTINGKFREIECWVSMARESLTASLKEADLIRETVDKSFKEFETIEREFNSFQEEKKRELMLNEQELSVERRELLEKVKLRDEELTKQQRLGHQRLESLEAKVAGRFKDIETKEIRLNEVCEVVAASAKEAELIRESANVRLSEVEKREEEFNLYQENKIKELMLEQEKLSLMKENLIEQQRLGLQRLESLEATVAASAKEAELIRESANVRLREVDKREEEFNLYHENKMRELVLEQEKLILKREKLIQEVMSGEKKLYEQDKLADELLKMLELAQSNVKDIKLMVSKRFNETAMNEIALNSTRSWVERKMDEVDFKEKELEEHNETNIKENQLRSCRKKLELKEQQLIKLDLGEKNLISGREFRLASSKECLAIKSKLQTETDLIEKHVLLEESEPQPTSRPELESMEEPIPFRLKELELKEQQLIGAPGAGVKIGPDESMDLKLAMKMERETFEKLIRKDLEVTVDEISEVLHLSFDPAKLVLDAMELFFSNNFRRGDMKSIVRRNCIVVLEQLAILSPTIQPCVRGEAIKLASDWKSKMGAAGENPLEVLGFLHLLAAYNISSCFDKNELLSLLMSVAQCKQTPELYRVLVLSENMPGLIHNLIQKKHYLLASTFIQEYKLEHEFPQAAVLNYSVIHSKHLAKEKCKTEHNSPEAQDKAIVEEIAALRTVIEHILKYGLEYAYSPDTLRIKINQLEQERTNLKKIPSSAADQEKQGQISGSDQPLDANKRVVQEKQHDVAKGTAPASKAPVLERVALGRSSLGTQPLQNKTRKRPAATLANVREPQLEQTNKSRRLMRSVEEERRRYLRSAPKRRGTNNLSTTSRPFRRSAASKISVKDRLGH